MIVWQPFFRNKVFMKSNMNTFPRIRPAIVSTANYALYAQGDLFFLGYIALMEEVGLYVVLHYNMDTNVVHILIPMRQLLLKRVVVL